MKLSFIKQKLSSKKRWTLAVTLIVMLAIIGINLKHSSQLMQVMFSYNEEFNQSIQQIFNIKSRAIIDGDLEKLKSMYNIKLRSGQWAYEHEQKKVNYMHNWEQKQGVSFTEINPTVIVRSTKQNGDKYSINLLCSTEYKYIYNNDPQMVNSFRIGTYHVLEVTMNGNMKIITKEWYQDPLEDSLNLKNIKTDEIREYISSQEIRNISDINERRMDAVDYADKYCGAASEGYNDYRYNKKYKNYNSQGGDCANFASQILFEGGKFKKTSTWNYNATGATRAWLNAGGFKEYMLNSGRASLIAYGSYEKVYKASYKLLPGDFVAYEKNGDITHISVVTGADSKGYSLVNCHNSDRYKVPWDLGWSGSNIKFWLVRVHF